MGRGRGQIICYNCAQPSHLEMDCQNPCTTCIYCNSFDHVIEDCPILLAKFQERQGGNQQFQKITVEPRDPEPRLAIFTRGGAIT
jgi:hypothetical protein